MPVWSSIRRIRTPGALARGHAAAGAPFRSGLPTGDFRTVGTGVKGVDLYSNLEVIYWLHQSRAQPRAAKPEEQ